MTIKKIFENQIDDEVHSDFLKYGKGDYKNKFLIEAKVQGKGTYAIKTGPEFANFLVKKCLQTIEEPTIKVKGIVVTTSDIELGFEIKKKSNFQGVKKYAIETEVEPKQVVSLMEENPRVFFALSFSSGDIMLKIKAKAPTSGKPGKEKEGGPSADFCTLKTKNQEIIDELFFDKKDFKEIRINHQIKINEIVYPSNMDELKPAEIREQAKRKGIIIRNIEAEGQTSSKETEFTA